MEIEEIDDIDPKKMCCFNCKFFETRTGFCRLNPPQIINLYVAGNTYPSANFPKIQMPDLDYCYQFRNKNERQVF